MALGGWLSKCPININGNLISTTVTNFPMLMVGGNFPSDIFASSGGCLATGGDIRFTTDANGVNEIARDIVAIDKTTNILSIYVLVPTITAGKTTTIYCWWNNVNANEPGLGSPSQKELVWANYYGVLHFNNMTSAWKGIKDISTSWNSCTAIGTVAAVTGHASGLSAAALSTTFGIRLHENITFAASTMDYMFWMYSATAVTGDIATGTNGIPLGFLSAGQFGMGWGGFATQNSVLTAATWHHVVIRIVSGTATIYVDGVQNATGGSTASGSNFANLGLGTSTSPVWSLSEFRMTRSNSIPVAHIPAMYICEKTPLAFTSYGAVETVTESYTMTLTGLKAGSEVRIYRSSDMVEMTGIESSTTTFTWNFSYSSSYAVEIGILHLNYQYIRLTDIMISASDITIPIQQVTDRNYLNP